MNYLFFRLLPKNLVSRLAGILTDIKAPRPLLKSLIQIYCQLYRVNLSEIKRPLGSFKCFNDFFTRELKPDVRHVDGDENAVVSPVDGKIAEFGAIKNGLLVQAKGVLYSMTDLVGKNLARYFRDGYFVTIYLSPADYHRIHAPVAGKVNRFSYFSGNLWPVNGIGTKYVGGLFALNERIVTPIETQKGPVVLVKVGATVVGKISVDYDRMTTNSKKPTALDVPVMPEKNYKKGAEIGCFQLGSTVILLFQKDQVNPISLYQDKKIKMGQTIAHFIES